MTLERSDFRPFERWTQFAFLVASAIAGVVTSIALFGFGAFGVTPELMTWLLLANFVLIFVLAVYTGQKFYSLKVGGSKGKLARRFATLFSFAAVVPAFLLAVFLATSFNRNIDRWFDEKLPSIVEGSSAVSQANLQAIGEDIGVDMEIMAKDLNNAVIGYRTEPEVFRRYLLQQASFRDFTGALILNRDGDILLASDQATQRGFEALPENMYEDADSGVVAVELPESTSHFWSLFRLNSFEGAYLFTMRPISQALLDSLNSSEQTLAEFRLAQVESQQLQTVFLMGLAQITLLILLFFIRYGISVADQITRPIARLAFAADDVRNGDLSKQVPMPRQDNEVAELTSSFNAMTQRLRTQTEEIDTARKEAVERKQFIEAVLQGVSAGVVRLDKELNIALANPSAVRMFPYLSEQGGGSLIDVSTEFSQFASSALKEGRSKSTTLVINDDQGQRHFLIRAEPTDDGDECILTFDDTSRLIIAQRQTAWRDVARRVAHEIRNPLTPIQLSAERLQRRYKKLVEADDTVFDRCIDTISRQVSDIGRMVEEFSSFARMPRPEISSFDLVQLVNECVYDARLARPDIDHKLKTNSDEVEIKGDERLIAQAVVNLLRNAREAVERADNSARAEIITDICLDDDTVQVIVEDTGPGFPKDRLKILEPYYTTREQGIGLGLAIVNRIIEDHGGQISLLDREDEKQGARVAIRLPLKGPSEEIISNWSMPKEAAE